MTDFANYKLRNMKCKITAFRIFVLIGTILFCIPEFIQTPFKILCLLILNIITIRYVKITLKLLTLILSIIIITSFKLYIKTFDFSILIILLSIIPIYCFSRLNFRISKERQYNLKVYMSLWMLCMIIQLMIYRYEGRPSLSYEINQSGSILFLFYILSRVVRFRIGIIFVLLASVLLLSRLLVLCIIIYEIFNRINKLSCVKNLPINYTSLVVGSFIFISIFSSWFTISMSGNIVDGSNSFSRMTSVNDGSNYLRFKVNAQLISNLLSNGDDELYIKGYGDLADSQIYKTTYWQMPHNEIYKGIAQFGLLFVVMCFFISKKGFDKYVNASNLPIFLSLVVYTLILWVRFTVFPSLEMIYILFLLQLNNIKHKYEVTIR